MANLVTVGDRKHSQVVGRRIEELKLPDGAQIGAIVRGVDEDGDPQLIIPHHDTVIAGGDHVVVFLPRKRMVRQIEKLFQPSATFFF